MAESSFCSGDRVPEASKLFESPLKSPQKPPLGFLQESPLEPTLEHPLESPLRNPDESKRVQDPVSVSYVWKTVQLPKELESPREETAQWCLKAEENPELFQLIQARSVGKGEGSRNCGCPENFWHP